MKVIRLLLLLALVVSMVGCGKPVPPEKSTYVGEWQEKTMYLLITQMVRSNTSDSKAGYPPRSRAPLKGFNGNNFEVGIGPMTTTFVVSKAPYQEGDKWKMVVDEVELVKIAN